MKYLNLVLIVFITNCNSQVSSIKNHKNKMKNITVTESFERFNEINTLINIGTQTNGVSEKGNYVSFEYQEIKGNNNIYMYGVKDEIYATTIYTKDSYYAVKKIYHSNTIIKEKGIFFNGNENTKLGVWYEFDSNGKVINKTNYDEGYTFSFEDVLNYCKENKINIELGDARKFEGGFHSQILKGKRDGVKVWIINYLDGIKQAYGNISKNGKNYEYSIYEEIILDGKAGKILSKRTVDFGDEKENKASFLADPDEKGSYKKPEIGIAYTEGNKIPEGTFQIYDGKTYTKAEWEAYMKTLPWWKKIF